MVAGICKISIFQITNVLISPFPGPVTLQCIYTINTGIAKNKTQGTELLRGPWIHYFIILPGFIMSLKLSRFNILHVMVENISNIFMITIQTWCDRAIPCLHISVKKQHFTSYSVAILHYFILIEPISNCTYIYEKLGYWHN